MCMLFLSQHTQYFDCGSDGTEMQCWITCQKSLFQDLGAPLVKKPQPRMSSTDVSSSILIYPPINTLLLSCVHSFHILFGLSSSICLSKLSFVCTEVIYSTSQFLIFSKVCYTVNPKIHINPIISLLLPNVLVVVLFS